MMVNVRVCVHEKKGDCVVVKNMYITHIFKECKKY